MLKAALDAVMERRARQLMAQVIAVLPPEGPVLDVGSGTGHLPALLEKELGLDIVTADVTDMHIVGPPPVPLVEGHLPFPDGRFSASLMFFMLHYPSDPVLVLRETMRVTRGPIILVQSVHAGRFGYVWLRGREFLWSYIAFHISKLVGYVPAGARFTMAARRFYSDDLLTRHVQAAGLRVRARSVTPILPGGALVVAQLTLERDG